MIAFVFSVAFCKISRFSLIILIGKGIIFLKKVMLKIVMFCLIIEF